MNQSAQISGSAIVSRAKHGGTSTVGEGAEFLTGQALSNRVRQIVSGDDVRIATAFWTPSGIKALFEGRDVTDVKILCDISLGATSRKALEELGAPNNAQLKHHEAFHGKIYISSAGLVVGSANCSHTALGLPGTAPNQLEAGTFHRSQSATWQQAINWFDPLHATAMQLGRSELDRAAILYRPPIAPPGPLRDGSLLDIIIAAPWRFADISFIVTGEESKPREVKAARRSAKQQSTSFAKEQIEQWPTTGLFTGWQTDVSNGWHRAFIEFWLGPRVVTVHGYRGEIFDEANGSVFARKDWRFIERSAGIALPERKAIGRIDGVLSRALTPPNEGRMYRDGEALAYAIQRLMG